MKGAGLDDSEGDTDVVRNLEATCLAIRRVVQRDPQRVEERLRSAVNLVRESYERVQTSRDLDRLIDLLHAARLYFHSTVARENESVKGQLCLPFEPKGS
jgi:hypothetical protein